LAQDLSNYQRQEIEASWKNLKECTGSCMSKQDGILWDELFAEIAPHTQHIAEVSDRWSEYNDCVKLARTSRDYLDELTHKLAKRNARKNAKHFQINATKAQKSIKRMVEYVFARQGLTTPE
jgi:phage shock protein A